MGRLATLKPRLPVIGNGVGTLEAGDDNRRLNANERGYDRRWRTYRQSWLRNHPLCGDREDGPSPEHSACRREGRTVAATDVDHIQRVHGQRDPLFWEPTNHQSLCHACHSVKTQAESRG